ncbi:hypothetical protein CSQ90_07300 [Janthinobacterium sp. BJB303]|nr:hypothetical protein CSQ90_07300 [Janthinobacterium sp. BJB303]
MKKVLWVKFGWSDYYRGEPVDGNFSWLKGKKNSKIRGPGHEAFNFNPGPDGRFYCYVPPQNKLYTPSNNDPDGWTVICLAKNPKHKGIHIVGWYENAILHGEWLAPPAGVMSQRGESGSPGYDWSYCISSKNVHIVPPEYRTRPFSDPTVRQGKYSFLAGPDVDTNESKKRVLHLLESRIKELAPFAVKNPDDEKLPNPELDAADPLKGFGTAEHRKKVEMAAERVVIEYYAKRGFTCKRVTHLPCGYDFAFTKGKLNLHVEVKGTAGPSPQFFLTRNEHRKGLQSNSSWRLAMVTSALSATPGINVYDAAELAKVFDLAPYVYIGTFIPVPSN